MLDRAALKASAKQQIKGNLGILFVCGLVIFLITLLTSWATTAIVNKRLTDLTSTFSYEILTMLSALVSAATQMIIQIILVAALSIGMVMIYLNLTKGVRPQASDVFKGFHIYGKAVELTFFTSLFTLLWSMLFIVPGIIKSIAYSMAPYILAEHPEMTGREAINESKRITQGHKGELFVLNLSFLLWGLLCIVTLGFGAIYVGPYIQATAANAYLKLRGPAAEEGITDETQDQIS